MTQKWEKKVLRIEHCKIAIHMIKEKVQKLEEVREKSQSLNPKAKNFPGALKDLAQEALAYCEKSDDEQEIHWLKKSIETADSSEQHSELSEDALEERDRGVSYLREALDSILIRERKYLD